MVAEDQVMKLPLQCSGKTDHSIIRNKLGNPSMRTPIVNTTTLLIFTTHTIAVNIEGIIAIQRGKHKQGATIQIHQTCSISPRYYGISFTFGAPRIGTSLSGAYALRWYACNAAAAASCVVAPYLPTCREKAIERRDLILTISPPGLNKLHTLLTTACPYGVVQVIDVYNTSAGARFSHSRRGYEEQHVALDRGAH